MPLKNMLWLAGVAAWLAAAAVRAAQPAQAPAANPQMIADWTPYLSDFQSADQARQEAAAKVFIESGSRGYAVLAALLKHSDPGVVKRATDVRQQIDTRSFKLYQEAAGEQNKVMGQPLTAAGLEKVRQAFLRMAMYASQSSLKQLGFQTAAELQKTIKDVEAAGKQLAPLDAQLTAAPEPKGLARAAVQMERANALKVLLRDADMLAAAQDAAASSGKEGRFTPAAFGLQAEAHARLADNAKLEATCRRILAEYPRSLEVKFAHRTLLQLLSGTQRWDDAEKQARAFLAAFPVDEEAQEAVNDLLENLMNEERDYARVGPLAEWLIEALPPDRLKPEVLKYSAGCDEYIFRDYPKAERAYTLLRDRFADAVSAEDMNAALTRVKLKGEGKFEKEPRDADAGLAGVFARFLKAARTRDTKALETLAPKDELEDFRERLGDSTEELVPTLVFADFILRKVDVDEAAGKGKLLLDYYDASSSKPKPMTQEAVKEDGQWKIRWQDPQEPDAAAGVPGVDAKSAPPRKP